MSEINTTIPSIRRIHGMIKEQKDVEIKLLTGDEIRGKVKWIDNNCICIDGAQADKPSATMVIWQSAIAFIKTSI